MNAPSRSPTIVRGVVAVALAIAIGCVFAISPKTEHPSETLSFIGRFHILALHVPIGVLVAVLLAEAGTFLRRRRRIADLIVTFTLPLFVLTGAAAIVLGLLLAQSGEYPLKVVLRHRNLTLLGILVAGVATLLLPYRRRAGRWGHRALLGLASGLVGLGAHFGGSLTHGSDFLVPPKFAMSSLPPDASDAGAVLDDAGVDDAGVDDAGAVLGDAGVGDAGVDDAGVDAALVAVPPPTHKRVAAPPAVRSPKQIAASVLNAKCAPCHTKQAKGGLRVTDLGNLKAGEVVAGDPASSKLYTRLTLPLDDDDHMPPIDKAQPSAGEIAAIRKWITELDQ